MSNLVTGGGLIVLYRASLPGVTNGCKTISRRPLGTDFLPLEARHKQSQAVTSSHKSLQTPEIVLMGPQAVGKTWPHACRTHP